MGKVLELAMDKRLANNGFILLELLIVIFVIGILSQLTLSFKFQNKNILIKQFKTDLLFRQSMALLTHQKIMVNHNFDSNVNYLSFNDLGHINQAQTININDASCKILLSLGRIDCE